MITLYDFNDPEGKIDTQYGYISYFDWMTKEKQRIERDPTRKAKIVLDKHLVSLSVNEVPNCECQECKKFFP